MEAPTRDITAGDLAPEDPTTLDRLSPTDAADLAAADALALLDQATEAR